MAVWVTISGENDLPKLDGFYLMEDDTGNYGEMGFKNYQGTKDWWLRNVRRWLDETQPLFTAQQLSETFDCGAGMLIYQPDFLKVKKAYFKNNFNIEL